MRYDQHRQTGEALDKIVVLDRFRSGRSLSPLRQAEAYWQALGGGTGKVPRRDQIDPRGLQNILAHSFILERVGRRGARFRVAGDHLTELAGMDLRGAPFSLLFADAARDEAGALLQRVFATPAVAELRLQTRVTPGAPAAPVTEGRMLLLPLSTKDGQVDRALGVLVADQPGVGSALPIRFDIVTRLLRPVDARAEAGETAQPAAQVSAPEAQPQDDLTDGMAESRAEWSGQPHHQPQHLRLVK